jgi:hypothetical protein
MAEVNTDVARKGSQEFSQLATYGDLKKAINSIKLKQKGAQIGNVAIDTVVGLIPGLSQAKTTYDFVKAAFLKPDTKKTNTWIDKLDIDDAMSSIIDDTVENGFLKMISQTIDSESDTKPLESDFNMNKKMVDYLKRNYSGRTVTGIQEAKMNNLRELIRQTIEQVLDEENATSGGEAYMTKFAFSKGGKNKATKYAEKLGMKVVGKVPKSGKTFEFVKYEGQDPINEVSYRSFNKTISEVTPERKISKAILGIKKRLREVNQIVDYSIRLREENSLTTENYLTNSVRGLEEISTRLIELDKKIKNLKE